MEFETVERCGRIHVVMNGVESTEYVRYSQSQQRWRLYLSHCVADYDHPSIPLKSIAKTMDTWYTAAEAAAWLVENGVFDKVSAHDVCLWARNGLLPGAVKITGKGGAGQGGSWRIPEAALVALVQRRRGQ